MIRSAHLDWIRLVALVGIGIAILLAGGCDGGGSKRDSLYQQLRGSWRIEQVRLKNDRIPFEDTVRVEFLQRQDARSYRVIRADVKDTTASGRVDVPRSNVLRMTSGFSGLLVWEFEFDGSISVQFRLSRAENEGVQEFLTAIGLSGGAQRLTLDLLRDSD